jgi:pyruvate/oxaloacetate carboxyltransferase
MAAVAKYYREQHPKYEFCEMKMAGAVDYRVFQQGILGGQISVLRNELVRQGYGHLFDNVIDQIQRVRTQVGGVALVTPTSEHVARQSIVNAMNGLDHTTDTVPFWPGYSEMLRGTMGRPPMRPQESLQKRALREWTEGIVKGMGLEDSVTDQINAKLPNMIDFLWELSHPIRDIRDAADLQRRVDELTDLDAQRFAAEIKESQSELDELNEHIKKNPKDLDSGIPICWHETRTMPATKSCWKAQA